MSVGRERSSFRDRSGFVFYDHGLIYRIVNTSYKQQYDQLTTSGLYNALIDKGYLVRHNEVPVSLWPNSLKVSGNSAIYKILQVEKVPYISYPYEWCFQQLKDAALLTLQVQLLALEYNMTLKDASAFNVQFLNGHPVFIDTLSFESYEEGKPWIAYRQFCTHFLASLSLQSLVSSDLHRLNQLYVDGIPLALTSAMLPFKTRFSPFFQMHIHYHAKLENKYAGDVKASKKIHYSLSKVRLTAIMNHLLSGIRSLTLPISQSEWSNYYQEFSYADDAIDHKKQLVKEWAIQIAPGHTWDLGCNTGLFSELLQPVSKHITTFDIDHLAIEKFYINLKKEQHNNIIPLVLDLNNPTPAIGWANAERKSFADRGPVDLILALALIHHISISNNVPFSEVAWLFHSLSKWLIIEFVPKEDAQSQRLLITREDIFHDYTIEAFEAQFQNFFEIVKKERISGTVRTLYLMRSK